MCGIVAVLGLQDAPVDDLTNAEQVRAGLDRLEHRGPDGRGVWQSLDGRCVLGHCRLSINDLTLSGSQPLHSTDGEIHAIVNGELYDDGTLRSSLESSFEFAGCSDSELALALYRLRGIHFLSYLRGEFAMCLYDSKKDIFIAARDRYGVKPLFWRRDKAGRIWFAAEIKAFLETDWHSEWDVEAIASGGWGQDTRTVFRDVQKLRPGHYMVSRNGGQPEIRQYWDISYPDKLVKETRKEEEMIQQLRELLLDSVRLRLRADVPIGIYLSGGIDSSALAGMANHLIKTEGLSMGSQNPNKRVGCFSIGFDEESGFDESSIAQRTASWLGVNYFKTHMSEAELASRFEDATYHIEHHTHDLNYVGKYALSEVPRSHGYKVVLTGEGADEQFAGYPLFAPDFLREPDNSQSRSFEHSEALVERSEAVIKDSYDVIGGSTTYFDDPARARLHGLATPTSMSAFNPSPSLFKSWVRCNSSVDTIADNIPPSTVEQIRNCWHPLHSALYVWTKGHLTNQFLSCLGDRVEMAHSVEARVPFLDHRLTAYINGLPPSLKLKEVVDKQSTNGVIDSGIGHTPSFVEKYALREAVRPFVTDEVYKRRKHAYTAPSRYPLGGPIHRKLEELLTRENVEQLGFIQYNEVQTLKEQAFLEGVEGGSLHERKVIWAWRQILLVAQWVILSRRFGVATAKPEHEVAS